MPTLLKKPVVQPAPPDPEVALKTADRRHTEAVNKLDVLRKVYSDACDAAVRNGECIPPEPPEIASLTAEIVAIQNASEPLRREVYSIQAERMKQERAADVKKQLDAFNADVAVYKERDAKHKQAFLAFLHEGILLHGPKEYRDIAFSLFPNIDGSSDVWKSIPENIRAMRYDDCIQGKLEQRKRNLPQA